MQLSDNHAQCVYFFIRLKVTESQHKHWKHLAISLCPHHQTHKHLVWELSFHSVTVFLHIFCTIYVISGNACGCRCVWWWKSVHAQKCEVPGREPSTSQEASGRGFWAEQLYDSSIIFDKNGCFWLNKTGQLHGDCHLFLTTLTFMFFFPSSVGKNYFW